jgi:hypothetical protein
MEFLAELQNSCHVECFKEVDYPESITVAGEHRTKIKIAILKNVGLL